MVTGPYRQPIVTFLKEQASESSCMRSRRTRQPRGTSLEIATIEETHKHDLRAILEESLEHEETALGLYKDLLVVVQDASIYLEEYTRGQIGAEEQHVIELRKMLRDYGTRPSLADQPHVHVCVGSDCRKDRPGAHRGFRTCRTPVSQPPP